MRIGMFTELYTPSVGGQEIRFAALAQGLRRRGHEVSVYCLGHRLDLPPHETIDGVEVHRHPIVADYRRSLVPGMPRGLQPILRYGWRCREVVRRGDFDFHIYNQWPFGHVLLAPRHVRRHSVTDWCEVRDGVVYRVLQRRMPRLTKMNMAVSPAVAEAIAAGADRQVSCVPSGVSLAEYSCAPDRDRSGLLYVGRLSPHKRLPLLVDAFGELRRQGYDGTLTIGGTGPSLGDIETQIALLDPDARSAVRVAGHLDDPEKVALLANSAVLVIPSRREGFPRVVAEAMASGLPVVTTADPGNGTTSIVRQYDLGAVVAADPLALAGGVRSVLDDWRRYSVNGLTGAVDLDWDHILPILEGMALDHRGGTLTG